jgi:hypothetical protein
MVFWGNSGRVGQGCLNLAASMIHEFQLAAGFYRGENKSGACLWAPLLCNNGLLLLGGFLASHSGLETSARGEAGHGGGSDLDFLASLGVAAGAGCALGRFEGTKANESDGIAFGHSFDYGIDECVECFAGGGFADVGSLGGGIDQFGLVHGISFG